MIGVWAIVVAPAQSQDSAWEGPYTWFANQTSSEIEHAAVIGKPGPNQGKVIFVRDSLESGLWLWDPAAPTTLQAYSGDNLLNNMSCAGQSWDGDGDLIWAGGDKNTACGVEPFWTHICWPDTWDWSALPNMLLPSPTPPPERRFGYYYPATVALHDGRVATLGGGSAPWRDLTCGPEPANTFRYTNYWQVFDKVSGVWHGDFPGLSTDVPVLGLPPGYTFSAYPGVFLQSTGYLFLTHSSDGSREHITPTVPPTDRRYSPSGWANVTSWPPTAWTMQSTPANWSTGLHLRNMAGQAINLSYPTGIQWPYHVNISGTLQGPDPDKSMLIGGHDTQPDYFGPPPGAPGGAPTFAQRQADNGVWVITNPVASNNPWMRGLYGNLTHRRVFPTAVITPDLTLMVFGGSANHFILAPQEDASPVKIPEMLDLLNLSLSWQDQPEHVSPRLYHHISMLLRDGRILVGSGYKATVNMNPALVHTDAEIFSPPCIQQAQPRPSIDSAPASISYGAAITLTVSLAGFPSINNQIMFATLIRCGALTHHFTADQRVIRLDVMQGPDPAKQITLATLPSQANGGHFIAPPGYYYLFVVTTPRGTPPVRVPSVAKFVQIG